MTCVPPYDILCHGGDFAQFIVRQTGGSPLNAFIDSSLAVVSKPPTNSIIVNGGQVIVSAKGNIRNQVRFQGNVTIKSEFQPVSLNEIFCGTSPIDNELFYMVREDDRALVYSKSGYAVQVGSVCVKQAGDSACLYKSDANSLVVINLHDSHQDSVQIVLGRKIISLSPGERIVLCKSMKNVKTSSDGLACRFKRDFCWTSDVAASLSELSPCSLLSSERLISKLLKDKSGTKIYKRIFKSLLSSSVVRAWRGPFNE